MKRVDRLHIEARARTALATKILIERKQVNDVDEFLKGIWEEEVDNLRTIEELKKNKKMEKYYDIKQWKL